MAAPNHPKNSRVRVSTTEEGTYANVGYVRSFQYTEGSENATTLKWLGGEARRAGDSTLSGTLPLYFDRADTTGQEILRAAKRSGDAVWIQICPLGTATGAKVEQFSALITQVEMSSDSTAQAVEGSITFDGDPSTLETITLA